MTDLTELRRLAEAATPGPWHLDSNGDSGIYTEPQPSPTSSDVATAYFDADERLIVAAVNALPALLDAAEALERVKALVRRVASVEDEPDAGWNAGREHLLHILRRAIDGEPQP